MRGRAAALLLALAGAAGACDTAEDEMKKHSKKVYAIVVHHTGLPAGWTPDQVTAAVVKRWHLQRHFQDIGYHHFIEADGDHVPGRDEKLRGAHVAKKIELPDGTKKLYSANNGTIAVCLAGDFVRAMPTPKQLNSLRLLIGDIRARHKGYLELLGHKEVMARLGFPNHTDCPGVNWFEMFRYALEHNGDFEL